MVETRRIEEVARVLDDVEKLTLVGGYHAAGFVSYEAGAAFGLRTRHAQLELAADLVRASSIATHVRRVDPPIPSEECRARARCTPRSTDPNTVRRCSSSSSESRTATPTRSTTRSACRDPSPAIARDLFAELVLNQAGRHSAYLHLGAHSICSASPELFFARDGRHLTARPMKGTVGARPNGRAKTPCSGPSCSSPRSSAPRT